MSSLICSFSRKYETLPLTTFGPIDHPLPPLAKVCHVATQSRGTNYQFKVQPPNPRQEKWWPVSGDVTGHYSRQLRPFRKQGQVRMGVCGWESVAIVSRDVALTVFPSTAWLGGSLCDLCFLGGSFRTMGIYNRRCHLKTFCFFSSYHHLLTPRHSTQEVILEDHTLS